MSLYGYRSNLLAEISLSYSPLRGNDVTKKEEALWGAEFKDEFDLALFELTGGVRYLFPDKTWGIPYMVGGLGFYNISGDSTATFTSSLGSDSESYDTSTTELGINGGGGVMYFFKDTTAIDIQGKLHMASKFTYLSILGGVTVFLK